MASIAAMFRARKMIAIVTIAVAATLAGCGGGDETEGKLPSETATALIDQLDQVQANVEVGSCVVAGTEADDLLADVQALPDDVDEDLRRGLENGVEHLQSLLEDPDQCERPEVETTTEEPTTTEEEPTETEPTTTTEPTETEPTTTDEGPPTTPQGPGGTGGLGPAGGSP